MDNFICSPSTLNLFINDPCAFILKHYFGIRGEENIYSARGKAVESGVNKYYETKDLKLAKQHAVDSFLNDSFFLLDNVEEVENQIETWVENAINVVTSFRKGSPVQQQEIDVTICGIPFRGFTDYIFEDAGLDLKTVNKCPTLLVRGERKGLLPKYKDDNIRQQVIYNLATKIPFSLGYVGLDSSLVFDIPEEEVSRLKSEIFDACEKLNKLLDGGKEKAISTYHTDINKPSAFWSEEMKDKAKELWK